jgi:chromosome segregation ATPase
VKNKFRLAAVAAVIVIPSVAMAASAPLAKPQFCNNKRLDKVEAPLCASIESILAMQTQVTAAQNDISTLKNEQNTLETQESKLEMFNEEQSRNIQAQTEKLQDLDSRLDKLEKASQPAPLTTSTLSPANIGL